MGHRGVNREVGDGANDCGKYLDGTWYDGDRDRRKFTGGADNGA